MFFIIAFYVNSKCILSGFQIKVSITVIIIIIIIIIKIVWEWIVHE